MEPGSRESTMPISLVREKAWSKESWQEDTILKKKLSQGFQKCLTMWRQGVHKEFPGLIQFWAVFILIGLTVLQLNKKWKKKKNANHNLKWSLILYSCKRSYWKITVLKAKWKIEELQDNCTDLLYSIGLFSKHSRNLYTYTCTTSIEN